MLGCVKPSLSRCCKGSRGFIMAKKEYMGIQIDYSRDSLFDKLGLARLQESYMREDEESPQVDRDWETSGK